jgi:hypothetical protein
MPPAALRNPIVVAVLFALSGVITDLQLANWDRGFYLGGVSFGLLAAIVFFRPGWMWLLLIVLMNLVWIAAWKTAVYLITDLTWNSYVGMAIAGVIGGVGVAASTGIERRNLLAIQPLLVTAVAGGIASVPFGYWEPRSSDSPLIWCFAIWQCVTGVTLWACSSRAVAIADPKIA